MADNDETELFLNECSKTMRLCREIEMYVRAGQAVLDARQSIQDIAPAKDDPLHFYLMLPWHDVNGIFFDDTEEIMEFLKKKRIELETQNAAVREMGRRLGYQVPELVEDWPEYISELAN